MASRSISIPTTTQSCTVRALSSSSDDKSRMARDNAAVLRAMRKGEDVASNHASTGDRVDYRYRAGGDGDSNVSDDDVVVHGARIKSPLDLWGPSAVKAEQRQQKLSRSDILGKVLQERPNTSFSNDSNGDGGGRSGRRMSSRHNTKNAKKFVSFFDEVDELMEKRRLEKRKMRKATGTSLASLLDTLDKYPNLEGGSYRSSEASSTGASGIAKNSSSGSGSGGGGSKSVFSTDEDFPVRGRSIFEDIAPPPQPPPDNPNAYDEELFEQYEAMMRDELENPHFVGKATKKMEEEEKEEFLRPVYKWLLKHERTMPYDLPSLKEAISASGACGNAVNEGELDLKEIMGNEFRSEMDKQRQAFLEETGLTSEQHDIAAMAMFRFASWCAKRARAAPVEVAWEKVKESGIVLPSDTMSTLLYVVSTGGSSLSSFVRPKRRRQPLSSIDSLFSGRRTRDLVEERAEEEESAGAQGKDGDNTVNVAEEVAICHDLLYEPTENSTSLRVKNMIAKGDARGAEKLLQKFASDGGTMRLRQHLPILSLYCEQGDVSSALNLFKRMRNTPTVHLEPEHYVLLISALAEFGCFRDTAEPIKGAVELGYSSPYGLALFDELVTEMAEDVLEISSASARKLYNSLAIGFKDEHVGRNLEEMHTLAGMLPMNEAAEDDELVANRISVDHKTAICPRTKATLRLVMLEDEQRKQLIHSLHQLAKSEAKKFSRGDKKADGIRAAEELSRFAEYLDTRTGKPFTAIVDGANIAYYMQNFDQGRFNYHQIQFVVDALIKMKEYPLVIIPFKYGFDSFTVTTGVVGEMQKLADKERAIRDSLMEKGMLYRVPPRLLDDYYWMMASVSDQMVSRNGIDLDVAPQNEDGRWPGTRPMLVSNDQMRDHKLELLEPRLFRRWYSSHIVNYNFTAFVGDECIDREIGFSTPDFFSREIQGNPAPSGGTAWHFPVSDWDLDDRFVIRIPPRSTDAN